MDFTSLPESLRGEALKIAVYLLNKVPRRQWQRPLMSYGCVKGLALGICTSGDFQLRLGYMGLVRGNLTQEL